MNSGEVKAIISDITMATGSHAGFDENFCAFGGCMAIYAVSENLYGLFHLQLTDRNGEVFGNWLHTIKELTADEKVSFFIGKPHPALRAMECKARGE
ncbi:hypothetical protein [Piscirickettsia salmonis]|uniref:hypothetical protein n=1 Tax=Piscirickettsia salmonis TaxID=1238 RepID=UPI0012BAEA0C|nr:hypothetical protein [Piscirickettsia salmonis]